MRRIAFTEMIGGNMNLQLEGDPRELAEVVFNAMQHNRVIAEMFMAAAIKHLQVNGLKIVKDPRYEDVKTFIPPIKPEA